MRRLSWIVASMCLAMSASAESIPSVTINIHDYNNDIHTVILVTLSTKYPEAAQIQSASGKIFMTYDIDGNRLGYNSMVLYRESFKADKTTLMTQDQQSKLVDLYDKIHFHILQKPQNSKMTSTGPTGVVWSFRDSFHLKKEFARSNIFDSKYADEHQDLIGFVREVFEIGNFDESRFR